MIDVSIIEGKIKALEPSFRLMADMTGKASTADLVGFYAEYFAINHLAPDTVNETVREMLLTWDKRAWPTPEQIAVKTRERSRRERSAGNGGFDHEAFDAVFKLSQLEQWEHRLDMANTWRLANPTRFKTVLARVDRDSDPLKRLTWVQESEHYRKAFRDGAVVQACNTQAGIDERKAQRLKEAERESRAKHFAATGEIAA